MKNTLILRPGSGLCNRIRAIGAGIRLSRDCGMRLKVEWFRSPIVRWAPRCGMRVRFCDLFEPIPGVEVVEKVRWRQDFPWDADKWTKRNPYFYGDEEVGGKGLSDRQRFIVDAKSNPQMSRWLWTCFNFYGESNYDWLRPNAALQARVERLSMNLGDDYIGVHIRRTDNHAAINGSPIGLFTNKIDACLSRNPKSVFYVSSDDNSVKEDLKSLYGEHVMCNPETAARYTRIGEQDAVVELMLLAKARKIYGSYWSSFSEEAAKIGGADLEVLVKGNEELPAWITN